MVAATNSTTPTEKGGDGDGSSAVSALLVIGAPAGGTDSLVRVLTELPADIAVILAVQHPEAFDENSFRQALGTRSDALAAVTDGAAVMAERIYLPDPGLVVTVKGGQFRTQPAGKAAAGHGTIDSLFVSISEDLDGHTIGLVLAGTGGDGTLGLAAIKEGGGLTLAEATGAEATLAEATAAEAPGAEATGDASPQTPAALNGASAMADFVLPAAAMAERIAMHVRQLTQMLPALTGAAPPVGTSATAALNQIVAVLLERTGHDFHGYKRPTFLRRVQRRMGVTGAERIEDYLDRMRTRPEEAQNLFNDLLIGVTRFFRDPREFEFLQREVVPRLFEGKGRGDQVRVWVLGCATGEEAYSIAILLREHAAKLSAPPSVQIFATDLDSRALAVARVGRYPASIAADVSAERLARWFSEEGATCLVRRELRDTCVFSQHSLVKDTPFSRLDLVSCRNLLIYLGPELQDRVIPLFHFALDTGGYLFLGASEGIARHTKLFAPVERGIHIFRKLDTGRRTLPDFPATAVVHTPVSSAPRPRPGPADLRLLHRAERLAERHAPAYAIVDTAYDVVQFSPSAGRYIHPAGGAASLNLLDLAHADLRTHLRAVLGEVTREARTVRATSVPMDVDGHRSTVDLVVEPVPDDHGVLRGFVVLFKDVPLLSGAGSDESAMPVASSEHVQWLEAELRNTRERLSAIVEQLEGANEELKSSNEEYQSLNEELQSANEELATSKEEMQSLNEELTTVNHELANRVEELSRVNSDLKNLQQATRIATVFLDRELRVTNFTSAAAAVFHLVEADLGRPIGHIKSRVAYDGLQADVSRVLDTLGPVEREVEQPGTGTRYIARVLPYRSVDNVIAGVVVTFTDVTQVALAQEQVRSSEARLRLVTERIPQFVWTAVGEGLWTWAGPQWTDYTGQSSNDSRGLGWLKMVHPDDLDQVKTAWAAAVVAGKLHFEYRVRSAEGTYRWFHTRATPLAREPGEGQVEWFGTCTDVDEMRQLQGQQAVLVAELQHRTRNLIAVVRNVARRSISPSPERDEYDARLAALGRVQGFLSRSPNYSVSLADVVEAELQAAGDDVSGRVHTEGPPAELPGESVQAVALALHELVTNAVKYGAIAQPSGRLSVTWRIETGEGGTRRLVIDWQESGVAMPDGPPVRRGYGTELITRALPYQLEAETKLEFTPDGVRCRIVLPASTFNNHWSSSTNHSTSTSSESVSEP